ncbi:MAG: P-loop NTPase fold protein [Snowella sp.]|nr:P-loop NTPase fold protein [Snowella sp.]
MRIKPKDIEIDANLPKYPFDNDLLDREEEIINLTDIIQNVEAPLVLAVNAPWGTGKSTFIRLWRAYLEQQNLDFIWFNAWETDFAEDPLIALISKLDKWVTNNGKSQNEKWDKFKKDILPKILKRSLITGAKVATVGVLDMEKDYEKIIADFSGDITGDLIDKFNEKSQAITQFKEVIKKVLENLPSDQKNLIIFIDELDRCRPTYAIELLERIKHLFDIERLVFILSTDTEQLSHSICAVYGNNFDAKKYLNRFIDLDYSLKEPDLKKYIEGLFKGLLVHNYFSQRKNGKDSQQLLETYVFVIAKRFNFRLRDVNLLVTRLTLILSSIPPNYYIYEPLLVILITLRENNKDLYKQYKINSKVTNKVIDFIIEESDFSSKESSEYFGYNLSILCETIFYLIACVGDLKQREELVEQYEEKLGKNQYFIGTLKEKIDSLTTRFDYNVSLKTLKYVTERIELLHKINII